MTISKSTQSRVSKSKRSHLKTSSVAVYVGVLFALVALVMSSYRPPSVGSDDSVLSVSAEQPVASTGAVEYATTLDDIKSANLAANVASSANLSIANSVSSQSISISTLAELEQYNVTTASKTQITDPNMATDVLTAYEVVEGDTAQSIADKFGVSVQTVRWANNLTSDAVTVGSTVVVPAVDGVVYTIKDNDSLSEIAEKYKSSVDAIITANDLDDEASISTSMKMLLPGGVLPENERPGYRVTTPVATPPRAVPRTYVGGQCLGRFGTRVPDIASGYARGNCTRYAFSRRAQLGRPVPNNLGNANTWATRASARGYTVNNTPAPGAVFQTREGYYGHVGVVEWINPNGTIVISEMNNRGCGGYNIVSLRTIPNPQDYTYIH